MVGDGLEAQFTCGDSACLGKQETIPRMDHVVAGYLPTALPSGGRALTVSALELLVCSLYFVR